MNIRLIEKIICYINDYNTRHVIECNTIILGLHIVKEIVKENNLLVQGVDIKDLADLRLNDIPITIDYVNKNNIRIGMSEEFWEFGVKGQEDK